MPESLRFMVKRHSKELFAGLSKGLSEPLTGISRERILRENDRITKMVNQQEAFAAVIRQMGYVSGLVAVYTDPSLGTDASIQKGFRHYLNLKLDRCLFVFDGYPELGKETDLARQQAWLVKELGQVPKIRGTYRKLLEDRYARVGHNWRYVFSEKDAVFGVSSIYFSNMARLTAHLWYHAWASAHGDLSRTPFRGMNPIP